MGYRTISISGELLAEMFTTGWKVERIECVEGMPPGAKFSGLARGGWHGNVEVEFFHPDWEEPEGSAEQLTPIMRTTKWKD